MLLALTALTAIAVVACGKKKNRTSPEDSEPLENSDSSKGKEAEMKTFVHGTLPFELEIPVTATITESEDDLYAETEAFILYVFGMDTYSGGCVYNAEEILSLMNDPEQRIYAADMLRLTSFDLSKEEPAKVYDNIDGCRGLWLPLTQMETENSNGVKCNGDGFAMIYGKRDGIGVYVVWGIIKSNDADSRSLLETCALSLRSDGEAEREYEIWEDSLSDGTKMKFVYRAEDFDEVSKEDEAVCIYYDKEKNGYIYLKHSGLYKGVTSSDYLQSIIDAISENEGVTFSETDFVRGKMEYRKVTMSYKRDEQEMQEVICVSVSDEGSLWIVDLYGTAEDVAAQQENLTTLLWSLTEE